MPDKERELKIADGIKDLNDAEALLIELKKRFEPFDDGFNLVKVGDHGNETYHIIITGTALNLDSSLLRLFCLAWLKGRNSWK